MNINEEEGGGRGKKKKYRYDGACARGCPERRWSNVIPRNGRNRCIKRHPRGSWLHVETSGRSFGCRGVRIGRWLDVE